MDSSSTSTSTVYTDAKVTVRSRLDCITQIRGLLNTNRTILFRNTVFGPWLDISPFTADVHLLNYFYQREVNAEESEECPFLRFKIGDNVLEFGCEQFCIITGFHFGPIAKEETNIGSLVQGLEHSPFYDRLFPEDQTRKKKKIKGEKLKALMKPGKVWDGLSDEDAVRAFKPLDKLELRNDEMFCQWYTRSMDYIRGLRLQVVVASPLLAEPVNVVREGVEHDENYVDEHPDGSVLYGDAPSGACAHADDGNICNEVPDGSVLYVDGRGVTGYAAGGCGSYCEGDENVKETSEFVNEHIVYGDSNLSKEDVLKKLDSDHMENEVDDIKSSIESIEERVGEVDVKELYREIQMVKIRVKVIENVLKIDNPEKSACIRKNPCGKNDRAEDIGGENKECPVQSDPVDHFMEVDHRRTSDCGSLPNLNSDLNDMVVDDPINAIQQELPSDVVSEKNQDLANELGDIQRKAEDSPFCMKGDKAEDECPVQSDLVDQFMEVDHPPSSDCGSLPNLNSDLNDMVVDDPKNAIHQELPSDVVSEKNQDLANELGDIQRKAEDSPLCMKGDKAEDDFFQDLHADTPPVDRNLYFTDTDGYTGPMTQVVKDICPEQSNAVDHFMVVDHPPSFDCGPLPNLNASFSDFCDEGINLTPNADMMDMVVEDPKSTIDQQLPRDDMDNEGPIQKTSLDELEKNEELSVELSKSSQEPSADVEKNNEPAAEVVEVICIDVDVETDDLQFPSTFSSDVNVVLVNNVRSIFNANKRKRKTGKYNNSPYTSLPDTTPRAIRRSLRNKYKNISPTKPLDFDQNLELPPLEPFVENLERGPKAKRKEVNVPEAIQNFVDTKMEITFTFPWGGEDTFADVRFWKCLLAMDDCSSGWLRDEHLDVWVDLMWTFRPPDADWAMAGAFFCPCVMGNMLRPYWANGRKYPLPWKDVEKVLFPINEPGVHWATGELHIRTGVVTVFDSLPKFTRTRDWWNITMPDTFQRNLTKYLKDEGVLEAKGIETDGYGLTWKTGKDVPNQGCSYGDCGIWVCINLYRLGHKMSLKVNKPSSVGLAYRERMAEYFWKYKILYSSSR
ncbi:phospholipase-like protein [Artemisia annua]|uniref:Phospholipase-like protein n=1 Tax=Artemisia annua TaxID=35608 RepID=A0A2U1Q9J0_ARTAN|nr:phospholipase-like protein [Artemisia annua]